MRNQIRGGFGRPKSLASLGQCGAGAPPPSPLGLCREEQLGKQHSASLPPNGEANCYRLVGSVNMMSGWTKETQTCVWPHGQDGGAWGGAWPLGTHHQPPSGLSSGCFSDRGRVNKVQGQTMEDLITPRPLAEPKCLPNERKGVLRSLRIKMSQPPSPRGEVSLKALLPPKS